MNIDELIKLAYDKESVNLNISTNKHDEMLAFIEGQATLKKSHLSLNTKMQSRISKINFRDFIAVAAFIFILIAIPIVTNSRKNTVNTKLPKEQANKKAAEINNSNASSTSFQGQGPGIMISLSPTKYIIEKNIDLTLTQDKDVTLIIKVLTTASAKAISINDYGITSQSIIKLDNNTGSLIVDNKSFPLTDKVYIKAIGDKDKLYDAFSAPGAFYEMGDNYDMKYEKLDLIKILNVFNENNKIDTSLNASSLDCEEIIKNGDVVMVSTTNDSNQIDNKVYNINKLDNFIQNFKEGKKAKIRVIKYAKDDTKTWVNKLSDLEYDGNQLILTDYDVYSDKNKFIPAKPSYCAKIAKSESNGGIRYSLCDKKEVPDNMGMTLISFSADSIVK